ncbi:hypothetical protein PCE31107_04647 [Pandoraea cepalis]|uniref:Polysaccharide biosynthesis protein C-terminal domain-containing protein n=2 Tax=Pandoraea cepalis TaxID=2508294 RepID=A0A5E4YNM8_9BURK|nr:hypothetical protein PCE31107_04647 [Pandoraea cepalis]
MEMMVGVIAFVGLLAFHRLVLSNAIIGYASLIAGIAVLTNSVRVLAGFVQGTQTAPSVSVILIASTFGSVCVVTGVAHAYSISGWIAGRYLGEMIVLSALVWHLRGYLFRRPILVNQSLPSLTLISLGVSANVAQFVRLLCDNLPILGMTAAKVKTDQIGHFGLATLVLMGPTLIFAVIAQVELPQIVLVRTEHGAVARRMRRLMRSLLRSALLFSGIFIVIGVFNRLIFHFPIGDTLDLLIVLSMALPLRVTSLAIGTVLMALRQYKLSVYINSVEAVLTAPIAYYLAKQFGAKGAAIAFFLGSVLSLALHAGVLRASRLLSSNES